MPSERVVESCWMLSGLVMGRYADEGVIACLNPASSRLERDYDGECMSAKGRVLSIRDRASMMSMLRLAIEVGIVSESL